MTKNGIALIIVVVLIIIGFAFFNKQEDQNVVLVDTEIEITEQIISTSTDATTATTTDAQTSTSTITDNTTSKEVSETITYGETGFSPATITIKAGDTVIFKNNSSRAFWPASNNHPTHTIYPEFDSKKTILAGESWSFTFTKVGTWKYHDHRSSSLGGTIVVQ